MPSSGWWSPILPPKLAGCRCSTCLSWTGKTNWRRRISTVDLDVITSLNQLLFKLKITFTFFIKQAILMRWSAVLSFTPSIRVGSFYLSAECLSSLEAVGSYQREVCWASKSHLSSTANFDSIYRLGCNEFGHTTSYSWAWAFVQQTDRSMEPLMKGKAKYSWPPCTNELKAIASENANINHFLWKYMITN
jgi:hypothetical protein